MGSEGTLDAADAGAARRIAARLTAARGRTGQPAVSAGEVAALAALDAVLHRVIDVERSAGRADLGAAVTAVGTSLGDKALAEVEEAWRGQFSDGGERTAPRGTHRPEPGPELLAEMLVLNALNEDPAADGVRELVDDRPLRQESKYEAVVKATEDELGGSSAQAPGPAHGTGRGQRQGKGQGRGGERGDGLGAGARGYRWKCVTFFPPPGLFVAPEVVCRGAESNASRSDDR